MKRMMSVALIALFVAGSSAFACGCDKKKDKETTTSEQTACNSEKKTDEKTSQQTACNGKKKCTETSEQSA